MECCCGAPCARLEHLEVYIPSRVISLARKMPHTMVPDQQHQSYRFSLLRCLLSDVTIDGKKIKIWSSEGHGRLGRVYALTHPRHVLKVSKTGLEASNYSLLASHNIPCAHVIESRDVRVDETTYSVTVMTRLDFTLTALLRAAGIANRKPRGLSVALSDLLDLLRKSNIAYVDLSPDNIMFSRVRGNVFRVHLIDPQFVTSLSIFERLYKSREYDCMYLACKLFVLGKLHARCWKFAQSLCRHLLGYVPSQGSVVQFLQEQAPRATSIAQSLNA
jgi:hypothetical protein